MKFKINECFDKLKPGMFVKTYADKDKRGRYCIIGEIGIILKDGLVIFTNTKTDIYAPGIRYMFINDLLKLSGYEKAWVVSKDNKEEIEILDKLPEEEEEDKGDAYEEQHFSVCPLNELKVIKVKAENLLKRLERKDSIMSCEKCSKLKDLADKLGKEFDNIYFEINE